MNRLETKSMVLLRHHLKALKLPTIHAECEKVASRCAEDSVAASSTDGAKAAMACEDKNAYVVELNRADQ